MTISELKQMYHDEYADIEVYKPADCRYPDHFHTDNCKPVDEWNDETKIGLYQLMDEDDYNNTILANYGEYADFKYWYGNHDAKILVCMVKNEEEESK